MQEERYGSRDRAYSAWHRRHSIRRYVGIEQAQLLAMIDLDAALYVEYDDQTKEPLALIEAAVDVGQAHKTATVSANLARRAGVPCYCVLYTHALQVNPADASWNDIAMFRVKRVWPEPEEQWRDLTPAEWANALLQVRSWRARQLDRENKRPWADVGPLRKAAAKVKRYPTRQTKLNLT